MNPTWSGHEELAASKAEVWTFINDPTKIAACVPNVIESRIHDAHRFDAVVRISVGPMRGKLTFTISLNPDADGHRMMMTIGGAGFGSTIDLVADADLTDNGSTTALDWRATATMRGTIAAIGAQLVDAQVQNIIGQTFANIGAHFSNASEAPQA